MDWSEDIRNIVLLYVLAVSIFVLGPVILHPDRRVLCLRRIRERRWDVEDEPNENQNARRETDPQNAVIQGTEHWEQKQVLLLKQLSTFTVELTKENFQCATPGGISESFSTDTKKTDSTYGEKYEDEDDNGCELVSSISFPRNLSRVLRRSTTYPLAETEDRKQQSPSNISTSLDKSISITEVGEKDCEDSVMSQMSQKTAFLSIPNPGISIKCASNKMREVTSTCAVCLCNYVIGDRVCWSSNDHCPHIFHEDCIMQWLFTLLDKQRRGLLLRNQRSQRNETSNQETNNSEGDNGELTTENQENRDEANENTDDGSSNQETNNSFNNDELTTENQESRDEVDENTDDTTEEDDMMILSLARECPCCRQDFIVPPKYASIDKLNQEETLSGAET